MGDNEENTMFCAPYYSTVIQIIRMILRALILFYQKMCCKLSHISESIIRVCQSHLQ